MNAVEIYEKASWDLEHSKITLGEFEERIKALYDVEPVRHGYWKVVSDGYGDKAYICECSECKDTVWVYKNADRKWNYCPNCGAKMDGQVTSKLT